MKEYLINLTDLVNPPKTDSISGREFGEQHAIDVNLSEHFESDDKIIIIIDSEYVKAINDSFIKGFFSSLFNRHITLSQIREHIEVKASENFKRLFEKNWMILDAINNV